MAWQLTWLDGLVVEHAYWKGEVLGSNLSWKSISLIRDFDLSAQEETDKTSGILYTWTGLGKSVHTGTYQYVLVQHSTRQYENLTVVRTGMYWYIPVRTLKKTSCFLTHPERVRRDKIKAVQLLCMGYNVAKLNFKTTQV